MNVQNMCTKCYRRAGDAVVVDLEPLADDTPGATIKAQLCKGCQLEVKGALGWIAREKLLGVQRHLRLGPIADLTSPTDTHEDRLWEHLKLKGPQAPSAPSGDGGVIKGGKGKKTEPSAGPGGSMVTL